MTWRVLIADDEPLARERVRFLLSRHSGYDVVAEAADGVAVLDALERERPDIVFLDISMPGRTGVEVAEWIAASDLAPAIVFVTAHDQFAVKAFEVSAIDYLVKPVDRERFDTTLRRVDARLAGPVHPSMLHALRPVFDALRGRGSFPERFVVRGLKGHYFVRVDDIESATTSGNYVQLAAEGRTHLLRETMKSFEERVDPARFVRIHRSTMVSVDRIARIEPLGHGLYRLVMRSGARFESSVSYTSRIAALLR